LSSIFLFIFIVSIIAGLIELVNLVWRGTKPSGQEHTDNVETYNANGIGYGENSER